MKKKKRTQARKKKKMQGSVKGLLAQAEQLLNSGQHDRSLQIYKEIVRRVPRHHEALCGLARSYAEYQEYNTAEEYLLKAIRLNPGSDGYRIDLGRVYCSMQEWEKVIGLNQAILDKDGSNLYALFNMGYAWRGKGERQKSLEFFEKIFRMQPDFYKVYGPLCANYHRLGRQDALLDMLQSIESIMPRLHNEGRSTASFVLGLYYDQLDMFDRAFFCFEQGNRLKLGGARYEIDRDIEVLQQVARNVDKEFLRSNKQFGNGDASMIFIVGMPRSGTSLLEQILSCHPEVTAGGELPFFYRSAFSFDYQTPESSCRKLADGYLQAVRALKKGGCRLTDKLPGNFLYAGLIALCFPNAKILHCVRDLMDTCFSCYKQNFHTAHYYSFDLESLGLYYNAYREHMRHWHEVLPGRICDVRYEDVVGDSEATIRKVLDWCGLAWNDECLRFHESSRFVETASRDQVTQPLYSSSVARWKQYEKQLAPLQEALLPELLE